MKKNLMIISLIVVLIMALALTGCGKKTTVDTESTITGTVEENKDLEGENEMSNVENVNPYLSLNLGRLTKSQRHS